jgi:hypothetical protein
MHKGVIKVCFCLLITTFVLPALAGNAGQEGEPPFTVAGTVIHPPASSVLLKIPVEDSGNGDESEAQQWFHEGDTISGYEIIRIEKDLVIFRHEDRIIRLAVGYGHATMERTSSEQVGPVVSPKRGQLIPAGQEIVPDFPSSNDREIQARFIPPPEDIDDIRKETGIFLEKLVSDPDFIREAEALRSRMLRQMEEEKGKEENG